MAPEFLGGVSEPSEGAFLPPADMFSLGQSFPKSSFVSPFCPYPCPFPCPRPRLQIRPRPCPRPFLLHYPHPHSVIGMVVLRILGHVDMEESELFRVNDRLRQNPAREVNVFFR